MGVKHTNLKFMSIERLETIRDNQYRSSCGKFEYCKETIDDELNRKYTEQDERLVDEQLRQLEQMENRSMETEIKTRQDYMDKKISHRDYYGQFVNTATVRAIEHLKKEILESTDEYLNDIPLRKWDSLSYQMTTIARENLIKANEGGSIATGVCIAKASARALKERLTA
jgi:glutamyl-tRNA reductase